MENQKMLENFKIEELEQRYEMGRWISEVKTGYNDGSTEVSFVFDVE